MEHTPGPWRAGIYEATESFKNIEQHSCICDHDNYGLIAICGPAEDKQSQIDAAFIVHACNCHDELLAAGKRALSFLHIDVPLGTGNDHELMQCQIALQSAIAKAEGKT